MVGSYGPRAEEYEFLTPMEEAPKGMLARGSYNIKSRSQPPTNVLTGLPPLPPPARGPPASSSSVALPCCFCLRWGG